MRDGGKYWDVSWSPVTGCSPCSPGCEHCFAERMTRRFWKAWGCQPPPNHFKVTWHPDRLEQPLRWRKPRTVFVVDMGDLFHPDVADCWIDRVMDVIGDAQKHTFLVLTKRAERMARYFAARTMSRPWDHLWLGETVCNQQEADEKLPELARLAAHGWHTWTSVEPMLTSMRLHMSGGCRHGNFLSCGVLSSTYEADSSCWFRPGKIVCGAETGPGARPMELDWARSLRDQCKAAGVPFWFKSAGKCEIPPDLMVREMPEGMAVAARRERT